MITLKKDLSLSPPPPGLGDLMGGVEEYFNQVLGMREQDPKVV